MPLPEPIFAPFQEHKVAYYSYGSGPEAVAFIHGWTCDSSLWTAQQPLFEKFKRTLLVDYIGHGNSDSPHIDYSTETLARSVKAALDHAKVEKAVFVSHSMGGPVSTMLLRLFPQTVKGIIYVDSFFHLPDHYYDSVGLEAIRERNSSEEGFLGFITPMVDVSPPDVQDKVLKRMVSTPKHVRVSATCTSTRPHAWRYEEVYDIPAMNVGTMFAGMVDMAWKHHMPRIELEEDGWKDCSHFPFMDQPERFNGAVERWIEEKGLM